MGIKGERNLTVSLDTRTPQCFPVFHSQKPFPETPSSISPASGLSCEHRLLSQAMLGIWFGPSSVLGSGALQVPNCTDLMSRVTRVHMKVGYLLPKMFGTRKAWFFGVYCKGWECEFWTQLNLWVYLLSPVLAPWLWDGSLVSLWGHLSIHYRGVWTLSKNFSFFNSTQHLLRLLCTKHDPGVDIVRERLMWHCTEVACAFC